MTTRRNREYLKVQLLETQRMLALMGDHPIMGASLRNKETELQEKLDKIPVDQKEPKIVLYFTGNPVKGSLGIDALFTSKVVTPFQNMITSEYAHRIFGKVGQRGKLNSQSESRLFITSLVRGSFGVELSKLDNNNLFDEDQLSDSLAHITRLIDSSAKSDEDFASELDEVAPRTIQSLKDFFKAISDDQAGVTIESGGIRCELNPVEVHSAFDRVAGTIATENDKSISGVLKGILLESWRFDFITLEGMTITGKLDENLTEDQVSEYNVQFFNKSCIANLKEAKVLFKNGRERITHILTSIEAE